MTVGIIFVDTVSTGTRFDPENPNYSENYVTNDQSLKTRVVLLSKKISVELSNFQPKSIMCVKSDSKN